MQTVIIQRNHYSHVGRVGSILDFGGQGQLSNPGTVGQGGGWGTVEGAKLRSSGCVVAFPQIKGLKNSVPDKDYTLCQGLEVRKNLFRELKVVQCGRIKEDEGGVVGDGLQKWTQAGPPRAFGAPAGNSAMGRGGRGRAFAEQDLLMQDGKSPLASE